MTPAVLLLLLHPPRSAGGGAGPLSRARPRRRPSLRARRCWRRPRIAPPARALLRFSTSAPRLCCTATPTCGKRTRGSTLLPMPRQRLATLAATAAASGGGGAGARRGGAPQGRAWPTRSSRCRRGQPRACEEVQPPLRPCLPPRSLSRRRARWQLRALRLRAPCCFAARLRAGARPTALLGAAAAPTAAAAVACLVTTAAALCCRMMAPPSSARPTPTMPRARRSSCTTRAGEEEAASGGRRGQEAVAPMGQSSGGCRRLPGLVEGSEVAGAVVVAVVVLVDMMTRKC